MNLKNLGAGASVFAAFEKFAAQGMVLARVALAQRDQYRLYAGCGEVAAEPSGALWYRSPYRASMPVTGDWVAARMVAADQAIVEAVLPRWTCFSRRAAGKREDEQPLAANVDVVLLVCGLDGDFNLRRLERYLTLAHESGASAVVVLNKADCCEDAGARLKETRAVCGAAPVVVCSARDGRGMEAIETFLGSGRTVALLGSSGVGKSTLINRILGEERFVTREVRESDSRGRHTTTHRELVPLPGGGALIDTPGMRELQLWASEESVEQTFDEIAEMAVQCRYGDCSHSGESGCAVGKAVAEGTITEERWESYRKLVKEARHHAVMSDPFAAREQKREWKRMHKAVRQMYKSRWK
jgi:ribosome biogenesis GTPase